MWFVYDPYEEEFRIYQKEEAAKKAFNKIIEAYQRDATQDGVWDMSVEQVCMGRITHRVVLQDVTPDDLADRIECGMASEGDEFAEAFIEEVPT